MVFSWEVVVVIGMLGLAWQGSGMVLWCKGMDLAMWLFGGLPRWGNVFMKYASLIVEWERRSMRILPCWFVMYGCLDFVEGACTYDNLN